MKLQRGVDFEKVLDELQNERITGRKAHPNSIKFPNQEIFIISLDDYIYYVPFVENEKEIFLKTIIPSRKLNKEYKGVQRWKIKKQSLIMKSQSC